MIANDRSWCYVLFVEMLSFSLSFLFSFPFWGYLRNGTYAFLFGKKCICLLCFLAGVITTTILLALAVVVMVVLRNNHSIHVYQYH